VKAERRGKIANEGWVQANTGLGPGLGPLLGGPGGGLLLVTGGAGPQCDQRYEQRHIKRSCLVLPHVGPDWSRRFSDVGDVTLSATTTASTKNQYNMNTNTNTTATEIDTKSLAIRSLAKWLGVEADELEEARFDCYGLTVFEVGSDSYAIGTDEEADEACKSYVQDTLWAFKGEFIAEACDLPCELADGISSFNSEKCEGANDAMLALVRKTCGLNSFVRRAISADGRGHFLASYDGDEIDLGNGFFAYRIG